MENIYIAGDGARWIKNGTEIIKDSKYVLDHYHLSKCVKILTAHLGSVIIKIKHYKGSNWGEHYGFRICT